MPHQCTDCGHTFPDGSKEMLSGCPDCGGNKFRFEPATDARESSAARSAADTADTPEPPSADGQAPTQPPPPGDSAIDTEDSAQTDARRDVASPDELAAGATPENGSELDTPSAAETDPSSDVSDDGDDTADDENDAADDSGMAALRQELNDQFESIKILEPGQYELNLMELYNREEYIIALQEDGQYVIEVPESWHGD